MEKGCAICVRRGAARSHAKLSPKTLPETKSWMMHFRDLPIKRKVVGAIVLTTLAALLVSTASLAVYEIIVYHKTIVRNLSATASIVAANSGPFLATRNAGESQTILDSLRANPSVVNAALYDHNGDVFARYPIYAPIHQFPLVPFKPGYRLQDGHLLFFEPVSKDNQSVGALFLKADLRPLYAHLRLYGVIAALVLFASVGAAFWVSIVLQRKITLPILDLAETARVVSERGDTSIRARHHEQDEIGLLAQAFNQMLDRIQEQAAAERKSDELRSFLVATIESSDEAIIGKDLEGNVVSWNPAATRIYGYSESEMIGQPIARTHPPENPGEEARILHEVKQGGFRHYETVRVHKDGQRIMVSLTASPIRDKNGQIIGISSISRDITEKKRAEYQIRQLNAELEQRVQERTAELKLANQELEAFTYSVAHDLRAPLRHIEAFSKILLEDFLDALPPEARQYLASIKAGSRTMSQLVDDLLNLGQVGRQQVKRDRVALGDLVAQVKADLKQETANRQISWSIHPLPTIECDPGLMKQVFVNLISNAVKYTRPRRHALIEIGSIGLDGDATIFVRDNGVGFNMKYKDKLFRVFQRLHRAEDFEGTGVGLATVDRIIRKHGGRIWAEAEVGKGATFYLTVPGTVLGEGAPSEEPRFEMVDSP